MADTNQRCRNTNRFSRCEGNGEVAPLFAGGEGVVRHPLGQIRVQDGTESKSVIPAAAEIGDVNVAVANGFILAPL